MRILCSTFLLFCTSALFSQINKIKIKKEEALYKATLAGIDTGYTSLKTVLKAKRIKVTNEKDPIEIYSYHASVLLDDREHLAIDFDGKGPKLTDELIKELEKGPVEIRIKSILAYNSFNETIKLNDIKITFVK